ncbi:hypothetical protein [Saccharomonospora sp. NB11]|uniref:hypothetical protein n=1 Tax=Saccharomonospora sp. NB11 TaxID=1642298 RepID=UPI001E52A590|nr:hypothetical protein [Saccharomonospora sp. NB11]
MPLTRTLALSLAGLLAALGTAVTLGLGDERKGEIGLVAALDGPLLPRDCAIGTQDAPIDGPVVLRFQSIDDRLAMPAVSGRGPSTGPLDHRLSTSGDNVLQQETYAGIRYYGRRRPSAYSSCVDARS